ncbi:hypothetical protein GF314_07630 [bacterium]|nr:hypothetical protein [bacterium]
MAGDGVSLQTNLLQLGTLAKAQARGPAATQGPNVAQELQKQDVTPVAKVTETDKAEQDGVDPDEKREKERRDRQQDPDAPAEDSVDAAGAEEDENPEDDGALGGLIDIKA